ncbi:2-iminoacetate synthase ThiH [Solitalea lacus]|uniref:2-iminoacetate synthase ThiH n=1 Tax=Solitalea lacus TaxID=2911172 RepID=UPI001EDB8A91|nr:2-iminoacetate synthase ThiH [Solitalea lacus]UKJ06871.1 2-iminoacetate synthase ThiH [Solitalea lacus]
MHSFTTVFNNYSWEETLDSIYRKTPDDVLRAIYTPKRSLEDFKALLSPAASQYVKLMAEESRRLTLKRFGKTIQLYIPLYLSNECQNICTYCGFSYDNKLERKTLTDAELLAEAEFVKSMGYRHVLLVSGEANQTVGVDYFENALKLIGPVFDHVSMEVQPLDEHEYKKLMSHGLENVLVYQETYHREDYKIHHPKGKKSNFDYRLETPDRIGRAGVRKMGLGVLLGLDDWRADCFFTGLHVNYLEKAYWKTQYGISFPRLRPCSGGLPPKLPVSDRDFVQIISAYRLFKPEIELSLSTRETPEFRDQLIHLGITSMSAGSKTNPGGYTVASQSLEQFEISDERKVPDVIQAIKSQGYEPVWKDWDKTF